MAAAITAVMFIAKDDTNVCSSSCLARISVACCNRRRTCTREMGLSGRRASHSAARGVRLSCVLHTCTAICVWPDRPAALITMPYVLACTQAAACLRNMLQNDMQLPDDAVCICQRPVPLASATRTSWMHKVDIQQLPKSHIRLDAGALHALPVVQSVPQPPRLHARKHDAEVGQRRRRHAAEVHLLKHVPDLVRPAAQPGADADQKGMPRA